MRWIGFFAFVWCIFGFMINEASACRSRCIRVIRKASQQKSPQPKFDLFLKASKCWYACSRQSKAREARAVRLQNAITSLAEAIKAAQQMKAENKADPLRILGASWVKEHTQRKLYDTREQYNKLRRQRAKFLRNIGYSRLDIFTGSLAAKVCVTKLGRSKKFPCQKTRWWSGKKLLSGAYTIRVFYKNGAPAQTRSIKLDRLVKRPEYFTPPYSTLIVTTGDSKAQIEIWQNKEVVRSATGKKRTFDGLILGRYHVKVRYPFASLRQKWVQLQRRKPAVMTFAPPKPVRVNFESSPAGAWVEIDKERRGQTPLQGISLQVGLHQIRITKPCYLPIQKSTRIRGRSSARASSFKLKRDPAWLSQQQLQKQLKRRDSVLGWSFLGVGSALAATGVALLAVGLTQNAQAAQIKREDPAGNLRQYEETARQGNLLNGSGFVALGVGLATLTPGLYFRLRKRTISNNKIPCQIRHQASDTTQKTSTARKSR